VCSAGHGARRHDGRTHDGHFVLAEFVRYVGDETHPDVLTFVNDAIREVPFYRDLYEGKPIHSTNDLRRSMQPCLPRERSANPMTLCVRPWGMAHFSSGGTSGAPKFAFFADDEFDASSALLARGYERKDSGQVTSVPIYSSPATFGRPSKRSIAHSPPARRSSSLSAGWPNRSKRSPG